MQLDATAEDLGQAPASNLVAELHGVERPSECVVLSAHLASLDSGSGATDKGTGTLVMAEAMRILALVDPKPKRTILPGHWRARRWVGSGTFADDHLEVVRGLQILFNQDNGTGRVQILNAGCLLDVAPALASVWR